MIEQTQAVKLPNGEVLCATETKQVCAACGYDLTPEELAADTCADCGRQLSLKTSVSVHATSVPAVAVVF